MSLSVTTHSIIYLYNVTYCNCSQYLPVRCPSLRIVLWQTVGHHRHPTLSSLHTNIKRSQFKVLICDQEWLGSWVVSVLDSGAEGPGFKSQSRCSLRQTVHTHGASVNQAAKLVAALLRVVGVTAGLAESNGSLPPGLWVTSPAGWLPRTRISSGTLRSVIEYGLALPVTCDSMGSISTQPISRTDNTATICDRPLWRCVNLPQRRRSDALLLLSGELTA